MTAILPTRGVGTFRAGDRRERYQGPNDVAIKGDGEDEGITIDVVKSLLDLGSQINAANQTGDTALHIAAGIAANRVVSFLVDHGADLQAKPCYDQQALMRRYDVVAEICDAMVTLGWKPYQNDHEDANGQFEMNWEFDTALRTADKHAFFKFMVKSIAEKHGLRATFMPKPFANLTGSGCHVHVSLWSSKDGSCLFADAKDEMGLSKTAYHFIGGVIHSAEGLCAITNPAVNSYKRINAPPTLSGATWSPNAVTYAGNNRTHMIRIPDAGRFELRLPDGAANPYLMPAALMAAGLDGIAAERDPGKRLDINMYTEGHKAKNGKKLPLNLLDALRALEKSTVLKNALGAATVSSYLKLKHDDWNAYSRHLTDWERQTTLDC